VDGGKGAGVMTARLAPWAISTSLAICCALLIHRALRVESEAARAAEASQLAAKGEIVAAQRDRDGINADLDAAISENAQLKEALDEARKVAPGATVTRVVRASTGPMIAGGTPRLQEKPMPIVPVPLSTSETPTKQEVGYVKPQESPIKVGSVPSCQPCLVAPGDTIDVRVSEVDRDTAKGNDDVVGTGECLRLLPLPETSLARKKFDAKLTTVIELEQPSGVAPGFGVGVTAFASGKGTALGLAIAPPPLHLWSLEIDLTVAAGTGSGGPHGSATALGRFWE
jgi:hypothetical protein